MDEQRYPAADGQTFIGTGEFELRDVYVVARVEVRDGVVHEVRFSAENGKAVEDAEEVAAQLRGQPLSRALAVKAKEVDSINKRGEPIAKVALLEAFHRAVEVCLDGE